MRKSNTQSISDVLKETFKLLKIDHKLKELELMNSWKDVVGVYIANKTKDMYIKNKVLFVKVDSSVVRNELLIIRESLISRLNSAVNQEVIAGIVIR